MSLALGLCFRSFAVCGSWTESAGCLVRPRPTRAVAAFLAWAFSTPRPGGQKSEKGFQA